jgi:hypothetical protein
LKRFRDEDFLSAIKKSGDEGERKREGERREREREGGRQRETEGERESGREKREGGVRKTFCIVREREENDGKLESYKERGRRYVRVQKENVNRERYGG